MLRIGITGQAGFIGTHLFNTLGLNRDRFVRVPFEDCFFKSEETLDAFVLQCDVIVHLAAMNRHNDPDMLYKTNIQLVQKLITSMERCEVKPYVIMSSSLQEERDNQYGRSKREGRELFNNWADRTGANFTGLIIPNVFGPFGVPFYNSVISTFSYQIVNGEEPKIEIDAELKLIYVGDLVKKIIGLFPADYANLIEDTADLNSNTDFTDITDQHGSASKILSFSARSGIYSKEEETTDCAEKPPRLLYIEHQAEFRVTGLLEKLRGFYQGYVINGVFPNLQDYFDVSLFNTLRSYLPVYYFPRKYVVHSDQRGDYVEITKAMSTGQSAFSTTKPGITRGNHFHTRKVERFAVIKGKAFIKLRKYGTDKVIEYIIDGSEPAYVDMPVWYTHNLTNIGDEELVTLFWINEFYDPADPDTYFEEV